MNSDFIILWKRKMSALEKATNKDYEKLLKSRDKLQSEILKAIIRNPEIGEKHLLSNLRECSVEKERYSFKIEQYLKDLTGKGLDAYTSNWEDAVEVYDQVDALIGELSILLAEYYPDRLQNEDVRENVKKLIPRFHALTIPVKLRIKDIEKSKVSQDYLLKIKKSKEAVVLPIALYYYYLQQTNNFPYFENMEVTKLEAIKELALKHNISPKSFQLDYNAISKYKIRVASNQINNIKAAIRMLADYPKALELANDELKTAELKR